VSKNIFNKGRFMWMIDYYMIGVLGMMAVALMLILRELKKIERKTEHPDEKPSYKKYWGHGKKKR